MVTSSLNLKTLEVSQDHIAETLKSMISYVRGFEIQDIVLLTMVKTLCLSYIAHTLKHAALAVPRVIARCKRSSSTYHVTNLRMLQFPKHKLIQDCLIWWESTLMMLKHEPE